EVDVYLAALGQEARQDSSNADPRFTRNRIRRELLPLLAGYNPRVEEVLGRLATQAGEVADSEEEAATALLDQAERPRAGPVVGLDGQPLSAAPRHRVRAALRLVWQREGWPLGAMGFAHWDRLADLVNAEGGAVHLPEGVRARRRGRVLQLHGPS